MPTPDELREDLASARADFRDALSEVAAGWERVPPGDGAWSPRQTAEHAIPGEAHMTTLVCTACGYPGVEFDPKPVYTTADDAVAALDAMVELTNKKLKYVTEGDLVKTYEQWTSAQFLAHSANHLREHAQQMREAANA